MPGTQAAGVRRVASTLQRCFVWDIERAFRCFKTVDLHIRPVYHWLEGRVRAHVFLCMLAYYLEWHMRQRLAPMLFDDTDKEEAEAQRRSVVAQAQRSKAAIKKCG
jgi:transposase